ncbi:MAG: UPF0262 family protein [Hyphomicrobium sp.]
MSEAETPAEDSKSKLVAITLDEKSTATSNPNIEHEREVAIFDIIEGNSFALEGREGGPYKLDLAIIEAIVSIVLIAPSVARDSSCT